MKTNTAYRFTDAEMETARETDLPDLLESLGYHVQRIGAYHTTKEMDSLRIKNRRTWYRYSERTGGDAITFLQRFCNKSFQEAVEYLLDYHGRARDSPVRPTQPIQTKEERVPFVLPPANTDHRRVFAYLRKRGIAPQVIRAFLRAGLLYEDAQHHNCVFVGRDAVGTPRFASCRGTYDRNGPGFKGDVAGSDKRIAFRLPSKPDLDWVLVFEAPIDHVGAKSISLRFRLRRKLRSIPLLLLFPSDPLRWAPMGALVYLTLHRQAASNAIALCGLYEGALDACLQDNPRIRRIALCLDADGPGQAAAEQLRAKYEGMGYAVKIQRPPRGKDWNEYLQQRGRIKERGNACQAESR